jgi:hypothetical protein
MLTTVYGFKCTYLAGVNNLLGVFDELKSLMRNDEINLGDYERSGAWLNDVTPPAEVADEWTFYSAPSRNIATMGT